MIKKIRPDWVYYILSGTSAFASSMFVVLAIYYVNIVKMDPLQLVLVGTVLEAAYFLSEIPTGVVADVYSRRLSIILGFLLIGAAWILEGSLPLFLSILAAEIVRAVGEAFLSGATEAWLADEVGEINVGPILVRNGQIRRVVSIVGTVVTVGLASWRLNLPVIVGGMLMFALGIFLSMYMSEQGFTPLPREEQQSWKVMFSTFRQGTQVVRTSTVLMVVVLISLVMGISSEGYDRLWEAHLLKNFTFPFQEAMQPVVWFGVLSICESLLSLVLVEKNRKKLEAASQNPKLTTRWLMLLSLITIFTGIGLALSGNFFLAFGVLMVRGAAFAYYWPLYDAWLIQHIRSDVRATVISMMGQCNAIGQVAGGPGVGVVGKLVSIRAALTLSALLFTPTPFLYAWVNRQEENVPTGAEQPQPVQAIIE
jgi:DHA3 family tetracycline resistance protein-like MFS transporter